MMIHGRVIVEPSAGELAAEEGERGVRRPLIVDDPELPRMVAPSTVSSSDGTSGEILCK